MSDTNRILFNVNNKAQYSLAEIKKALRFMHLSQSAIHSLDRFNDFNTPLKNNFVKVPASKKPFVEKDLRKLEALYLKWIKANSFNQIISAILYFLDYCYFVVDGKKNWSGKTENEITNGKLKIGEFINKKFYDVRKFTNLTNKLKIIKNEKLLLKKDADLIDALYKVRNCIEHWDGYTNSVSLKFNSKEKYRIKLPNLKIYLYNPHTKDKILLRKGMTGREGYNALSQISYSYKYIKPDTVITFSYSEIAKLSLWAELLIRNLSKKIATYLNT